MTARRFGVLVTCAGRRVGLLRAVRDSLADLGLEGPVVAADSSPLAPALAFADEAAVVGSIDGPGYVDELLGLCRRTGTRLVVPTIDAELAPYAAWRERFGAEGISVAVGSPDTVAIAVDKVHTHRFLIDHDLPTVRQACLDEVLAAPHDWSFPLLVKPRHGNSSRGVAVVPDRDALAGVARSGEVLVQELATGDELTVDVYVDRDGRCRCAVPRLRIEVRAGEVSKARTVDDPAVQQLAADLCAGLPGPYGAMNVQLFRHGGDLKVIEINARFGGGFPLTHAAGAPFVRWLIEDALELASTARPDGWVDGLTMLRFDDALYVRDGGALVAAPGGEAGAAR